MSVWKRSAGSEKPVETCSPAEPEVDWFIEAPLFHFSLLIAPHSSAFVALQTYPSFE